jgi:hypothetical protein
VKRNHSIIMPALVSALCLGVLLPSVSVGQRPRIRNPGATPAAPCVIDSGQITARQKRSVATMEAGARATSPPPKPQRTAVPRLPDASVMAQIGPQGLGGDISPQLCESLKTGSVTPDEVSAMLGAMEREHAGKSHKKRKQIQKMGVSYTYEYTLDVGRLKFYQSPGVGYCSDFDWRFKVRNVSQRDFTVFSTRGEVGLCASPGFGLFFIPGLKAGMPFPVPGLCFDDARFTKLDLRNVNDEFEGELVELVGLAFERLQQGDAKVCIIGAAYPPWFMPIVIPRSMMVAYCTSTRDCTFGPAKAASKEE